MFLRKGMGAVGVPLGEQRPSGGGLDAALCASYAVRARICGCLVDAWRMGFLNQEFRFSGAALLAAALGFAWGAPVAAAQTCTTQARMDAAMRSGLHDAALAIGAGVKAGDAAAVKAVSSASLVANFGATELLIRSTAEKLSGDTLQVSQVYLLDASARKANDATPADFACVLKDVAGAETDFSIAGLPPGTYGFAMVDGSGGPRPWLLSLLLEKDGGEWKMAGFYPKARAAAGHDGIWYWKQAREQMGNKQPLLSWLYYDEAASLLQPAPFVSTSNLDRLRQEQRESGPQELVNGLSSDSPLVVHGGNGTDYRLNSLQTESTDDGTALRLMLHVSDDAAASADAIRAHSEAAARALMKAHPELRSVYGTVFVFADGPGGNPPVVTLTASQLQ